MQAAELFERKVKPLEVARQLRVSRKSVYQLHRLWRDGGERALASAGQRGHRLRRGSRGGRPPALDREAYKQRNTVERCINRLKQWRGIATRYEKTATVYLAGLHVAGIFLWSAR
ncbi:hypothetical protein GCM10010446_61410 [Streptomyces enissocaesilis]|uniref:Transposase n=1 Tax=Streptomyces enissocaesilis TaxID=332589 RepID=A0ABP6K7E7_9ACTN